MAGVRSDEDGSEWLRRFYESPWMYGGPGAVESVDADEHGRPTPDLFDRLKERRWLVARMALEVLAVIAGGMLLIGLPVHAPLLGAAMMILGAIALVIDLIVLWRLQRLVDNAWVDLSRPPDL